MINRDFEDKLNRILTEMGFPEERKERVAKLKAMLKNDHVHINTYQIEQMLSGFVPKIEIIERLASELEVPIDSLMKQIEGKSLQSSAHFQHQEKKTGHPAS